MSNRKRNYIIISGIVLILLIVFFFQWIDIKKQSNLTAVNRVPDVSAAIQNQNDTDGNSLISKGIIRANESVNIKSTVRDRISEIFFEDGDEVEKGQILLTLNSEEEQALRMEAKAVYDQQVLQYNRISYLLTRRASSQADLEEEERLMKIARAKLDNIEAQLQEFKIRAPFAGILGIRMVSAGAVVDKDTIITTLDDISSVKLDFKIPENMIGSIAAGMKITAQNNTLTKKNFEGIVTMIGSRIDPESKTVKARAIIPNPDYLLKPGMAITWKPGKNHKL